MVLILTLLTDERAISDAEKNAEKQTRIQRKIKVYKLLSASKELSLRKNKNVVFTCS